MKTLAARTVDTPIGPLYVAADGEQVVGLEFGDAHERRDALARHLERWLGAHELREAADPGGAATRLARYFAGETGALDEQPVAIRGTEFQCKVWNALREIGAGETWTYAQLAVRVGNANAQRAVGAANGANPIALFVPCHRVIASDRTLWGYGGGLPRKRWLLAHEGASFADPGAQGTLALGEA